MPADARKYMITQRNFQQIKDHIDEILEQNTDFGISLWHDLLQQHPADLAQLLGDLEEEYMYPLFVKLPHPLATAVFRYVGNPLKMSILELVDDHERVTLLKSLPIDELTDFFDELSDEDLKKYLKLLHKKEREKVISLLKFNPESAGGLMNTEVLALMQDLTVQKSIQILQRLQPNRELHQQIFVTDSHNELVGHIRLEDLVLKNPLTRLRSILRKNDLVITAQEDREEVAQKMTHYKLTIAPVVNEHNIFLGVISSDTLIDIIEKESSEDVYRMSALAPIKNTYFQTSFYRLLYERSIILIILLLAQSLSQIILESYSFLLQGFLIFFAPMLSSAGGNASSQTSALVIQGIANGDITNDNMPRFLKRELLMALIIALILGLFSFIRVYIMYRTLWDSIAISCSLSAIVLVAIMLGGYMPWILKKLNIDPAFSAGPFLATLMDILGLLLFCYISKLILRT